MMERRIASPQVNVVILNYMSLNDTIGCVESVRQNCYENFRLLVIDNASPDGSGSVLETKLPAHEFMRMSVNAGYAGGNNAGIKRSLREGANFVLILNPDIRLPRNAISDYVKAMETHPDIAVLSPIQLRETGGAIDGKFEQGVLARHGVTVKKLGQLGPGSVVPVSMVLGAVMMVRGDVFRLVGGFDPLYFAYGEEEDFCRRVRRRGMNMVIVVDSPAVHLRTNEQRGVPDRILFLRTKGAYLLKLKDVSVSFPLVVLRVFWRATADLFMLNRSQYPFSHYAVTRGHVLWSIVWLAMHLPRIWLNRQVEAVSGPYLDGQ